MLLAEGWNSPRATVVMHLAPTASKRVYQQRIGRIMRIHPRKEAGIVVDFVPKAATHNDRVVSLHSRSSRPTFTARARASPRRRGGGRSGARRKLTPASWLVPVTPDVARRFSVIQREWQRIDPSTWTTTSSARGRRSQAARCGSTSGRLLRAEVHGARRVEGRARDLPLHLCGAEPEDRRLRLIALADRVSMRVERADFDDLVTLITLAPPWRRIARLTCGSCCARSPTTSLTPRSRSSTAGGGSSPAPSARSSTARPRRSTPMPNGCSEHLRTRAGTGTRRTPRVS